MSVAARRTVSVRAAIVIAALCGACKYERPDDIPGDGSIGDAKLDGSQDDPFCFGAGIGRVCLASLPAAPLALEGTIDTTVCSDGTVTMITGVETCVLAGTTVGIGIGKTLRGIGMRPLVLVASDALTVDGILTVGSRHGDASGAGAATAAASTATCPAPAAIAEDDAAGAGGGAGGSFVGAGGDGGDGDLNSNGGTPGSSLGAVRASTLPAPTVLRAGCRGTDGGIGETAVAAGGLGGGALYLIAGVRLVVSGTASAAGAGGGPTGRQAGGGGGGSGGMIGLDAPTIAVSGAVTAHGGGGGEGGAAATGGEPGDDGAIDGTRAAGGNGIVDGGNGGLGSGTGSDNGDTGAQANGGGGGGGAGYVYIKGALQQAGVISPAPDQQ